MTPAAARFVSPLTMATASGTPVWSDIFEQAGRDPLVHIHLARLADLVLVAPVTFDFIGKVAAGRADDPVSLLLAATTAPVVLAPAMHDTMWANPILQRNLKHLKEAGYRVIPPETGLQADGEVGAGRMASIPTIMKSLLELANENIPNMEN
jgi:phosphopantothenoylcysteine decarboxylase/phosphopantothenate--cysteine ligase